VTDTRLPNPGFARCPAPSTKELLQRDRGGAPAPLLEESYEFRGDADIPYESYTSRDYARLEQERLFPRVWQWACREDHLPNPGMYYIYDVANMSAIVVRTEDGTIKAYDNFCQHRGTQLKPTATVGKTKQFRCPFHGWTWNLEGQLTDLPCRWDFPHVSDESAALPELQVDTWGGFVFVNFDPNAAPLHDYLGVLPRHFATWDLADRYVEVHARKRLPCNWKAGMAAFLEAYHVLETHPEGIRTTGDANAQYDVFGENVSRFIHTVGTKSPHVAQEFTEQELLDLLLQRKFPGTADKPVVPPGSVARDVYAGYLQNMMSERFGRDFSHLSNSETMDSIEYFLFPNAFFFPGLQLSMVYRFRPDITDPDNPDFCTFDLLIMRPKPIDRPAPKPAVVFDLDVNDSYKLTPGIDQGLGFVYDQDTNNLAAQTRGFKGSRKRGQTLGNYQEIRARHLHQTVDRYINTPSNL
jgi:phenylpropionate dioxygenase-like ring-hydroxylating dioxygenase large terminal subunit